MASLTISGKTYRAELNFNTFLSFADKHGYRDLSFLSKELSTREWLELMTEAINEGERLDGKSHSYTAEDFGVGGFAETLAAIGEFTKIFADQASAPAEESKKK